MKRLVSVISGSLLAVGAVLASDSVNRGFFAELADQGVQNARSNPVAALVLLGFIIWAFIEYRKK